MACPLVRSCTVHAFVLAGGPRAKAGAMPHGRLLRVALGCLMPQGYQRPVARPSLLSGSVHAFVLTSGPWARACPIPRARLLPWGPWVPHASGAPAGSVYALILASGLHARAIVLPYGRLQPCALECLTPQGHLWVQYMPSCWSAALRRELPQSPLHCGRLLQCSPWVHHASETVNALQHKRYRIRTSLRTASGSGPLGVAASWCHCH